MFKVIGLGMENYSEEHDLDGRSSPTCMDDTLLCQKDSGKGNTAENYCPITCLALMWKLLKGVTAAGIYAYLEEDKLIPEEEKEYSRGGREQRINCLLIRLY